jgi:hypothetical protein
MSIKELKALLTKRGVGFADCFEKTDLIERACDTKGAQKPAMPNMFGLPQGLRVCDACKMAEPAGAKKKGKFKHCSRCKTTFYCSTDCQKTGWKMHKLSCVETKCTSGVMNQDGSGPAAKAAGYHNDMRNGVKPPPYIVLKKGGGGGGKMTKLMGNWSESWTGELVGRSVPVLIERQHFDTSLAAVTGAVAARLALRAAHTPPQLREMDEALFIHAATGDAPRTRDLLLAGACPAHTANYAEGKWYWSAGHTALMCAARSGFLQPLLLLIAGGADINAENTDGYYGSGWTPLVFAESGLGPMDVTFPDVIAAIKHHGGTKPPPKPMTQQQQHDASQNIQEMLAQAQAQLDAQTAACKAAGIDPMASMLASMGIPASIKKS